jgi:tRNA A37 threonylcarbamoyladenosine modification protein TsaB
MNIIAIDASTKSSGVAVYKHNKLEEYTCITSSSSNLFTRIQVMVDGIKDILIKNPDI